jgi:hypothetical protein
MWSSTNWSGTLAPGGTATVTIPAINASVGNHVITDSVAMPNAAADMNPANNTRTVAATVTNTSPKTLPLTANFESSGFPAGYVPYDPSGAGYGWVNGTGTNLARNGSSYMPWYKISAYPSGSVGYLIMPTPAISGAVTLEFWQTYAQKTASSSDKLEVIYSSNCGTSWNVLWSAQGAALATVPPTTSTSWLPSPAVGSTDWKLRSVALNAVPANSILAFRATAGGGNQLFIDDVNIRAGAVGVKNVVAENSVSVYPNPARESATLEFTVMNSSKVNVTVQDAVGRTLSVVSDMQLQPGTQHMSIPTATLAAGLYNIVIRTESGNFVQRLNVVK